MKSDRVKDNSEKKKSIKKKLAKKTSDAVGVVSLSADQALPARGNLRHHLPGAILGPYLYLGDKLFGVEPGFLGVRVDKNLLHRLYREGIITDSTIITLFSVDPNLAVARLKAEIDQLHKTLQIHAGDEVDLTAQEPEKKFFSKIKKVLADRMEERPERSKKYQNQLTDLERLEKLMAFNEVIKKEGMDKTNTKADKPILWLTKQDYNDGRYYPPKDRLANVNMIRSITNPTWQKIKLEGYETGKSIKADRVKENVNAILENLANDISRTMMNVQNQHLNIKRNNDKTLSFLTACQWEPKLEMLENCIYGSSKAAKYYVNVERDPVNNSIIKGYDLSVLKSKPDEARCEPNQYFLVYNEASKLKGEFPWVLYHTNSGGSLIETKIGDNPALGNDTEFQKYLSDKNPSTLLNAVDYKNKFAQHLEKFPEMDFYKGPVPVKNSAGFYAPDRSIEKLGYLAPFMVLLADNDTIGSAGQNKGRVGNSFFGIDFGHAFRGSENPLVAKMHGDFSFNDTSYKNIGTMFYDSEMSERMCGMFMMYKLMGKHLRDGVFNNHDKINMQNAIRQYEEKYPDFKEKYANLVDGSIMSILEKYKNSFVNLRDQQETKAGKKEFDGYIHKIANAEKFITKSLVDMMKKSKDRMQLSPDEVKILHNIEKLTSPTTLVSDNGNVLLDHMCFVDTGTPRIAWGMKKTSNNEIVIDAKITNDGERSRTFAILRDYIAMLRTTDSTVSMGDVKITWNTKGEKFVQLHLPANEMSKLLKFYDEETIKITKPLIASELDLTPDHVSQKVQQHLIKVRDARREEKSADIESESVSVNSPVSYSRRKSSDGSDQLSRLSPGSRHSSGFFGHSPSLSLSPAASTVGYDSNSEYDTRSNVSSPISSIDRSEPELSDLEYDDVVGNLTSSMSGSELVELNVMPSKASKNNSIDTEATKLREESTGDVNEMRRSRASTILKERNVEELVIGLVDTASIPPTRNRSGWS